MSVSQAFRMAVSAVWGNKSRSFLTMLGVIIGVLAVAMLVSIGQGAQDEIKRQMSSMGSNLVVVSITSQRLYSIPTSEVEELAGKNGVAYASPVISSRAPIKYLYNEHIGSIEAGNEHYTAITDTQVQFGRALNADDIEQRKAVALIGTTVAKELFGEATETVLNKEVTMLGRRFRVVGVLESKGSSMMGDLDDRAIIPISTGERAMGIRQPSTVYFKAQSPEAVAEAVDSIESFFLKEIKEEDGFSVFDQSQILNMIDTALGTLTAMLAGIAGISLVVGGVGIMNIMLVSVTERTREIGIRKAIGARRRDVLIQFLIESAMISTLGGVVGVLISAAALAGVSALMNIDMPLSPAVVSVALIFSVAVGVVFGIYPADKAAKLRPIDALRRE